MGLMDFFKKGKEEPVKAKPVAPTQPTVQQNREYVVKSGDSLSKIAKQYYGDASKWNKIFEANRDKIKNADLIQPGQKIIIP
ncbi:MAG: LysM peptidoglycan-binding domain-containing protein [Chryseolinea sp.]